LLERLLDANGNRAREALRVMEDAARFLLDDAALSEMLKSLRHRLGVALDRVAPGAALVHARDTSGDVGLTITTETEGVRRDVGQVVEASCKRLGEAVRTLEEYAKLIDPEAAAELERVRYAGYEAERLLRVRLGGARRGQWRVCVLLSESLCVKGDWPAVARASLEAGADALQLREKSLADRERLTRARELVALARPFGAAVIVNDRPDLALAAGAAGVHLGQSDLPVEAVRRFAGDRLIVGVSTERLEQAEEAREAGADYCGVGPMFETTTKDKPRLAGPQYLRQYIEKISLPHLAIGGVRPDRMGPLLEAGVRGVAVSSCVCAAADPAAVVRELIDAMETRRDRPAMQ